MPRVQRTRLDVDLQDAAILAELLAAAGQDRVYGPRCSICQRPSVIVDMHLRQHGMIAPRQGVAFCCACLRMVAPSKLPDLRALLNKALNRPVLYAPTGNFKLEPSGRVGHRIPAKADFYFEGSRSLIAADCDAWIDARNDAIDAGPHLELQIRSRLIAVLNGTDEAECVATLSANYGVREHPEIIKVEPTQFCNMRCTFCSNPKLPVKKQLRLDRFAAIWSTLDPRQILKVGFTGLGESLLNKDLWDMHALVKRSGIYTTLVTNGTLLARQAALIQASGLDAIAVSLESLEAAVYERDRIGARLADVLSGVERFVTDPGQHASLRVICAVKPGAHRDAISVIEFCHRLGLPMPKVYPVYERFSRQVPLSAGDDLCMDDVKAALSRTYGHVGPLCREDQLVASAAAGRSYEDLACSEPKRVFVIRADGSFASCNEAIFDLDDLAEQRMIGVSVENAWQSEHFRRRRLSLYLRRPTSVCARCNAFTIPDRLSRG